MKTIENSIGDFSIIPTVYEKELDAKYEIILGKLRNEEASYIKGNLDELISFQGGFNQSVDKISEKILNKNESAPGFSSMQIDTKKELLEHVKNIHEISYLHYAASKESGDADFPSACCGESSRNMLLTLMDKGYVNATLIANDVRDHTYIALPFLLGREKRRGFIITDPTSDQLFDNEETAPRNNTFVSFGEKWKYKTDWKRGRDLFPIQWSSTFAHLQTIRDINTNYIIKDRDIEKYFNNVFDSSVKILSTPSKTFSELI